MLTPTKRRPTPLRRPLRIRPQLEVLEDRTLLSSTPTTLLDLNGLGVNPNQSSSTDVLVRFQTPPGSPGGPALVPGTSLATALPLVSGLYDVRLSPGISVAQALAAYQAEKGVIFAEPNFNVTAASVPNDPLLNQQWNLANTGQTGGKPGSDIHAEQAWSVTTGNSNVVVALMDTGIDYSNPDLYENVWINQAEIPSFWYTKSSASSGYNKIVYKSEIKTETPGVITFRDLNNPVNAGLVWDNNADGRIDATDLLRLTTQGGWEYNGNVQDGDTAHPNDLFGWNFVSNNNNPYDDNGHGTNVAGIIGAIGNNGTGVAGIDWNVQMMPVKFMNNSGYGTVSDFIEALNYEVQHGAKISNNSWQGAPYSQAFYDAVNNTRLKGQIFVVAAGNGGTNNDTSISYPAGFSPSLNNVVSVAATDNNDNLASFSNYGPHSVELAAPGVNILSTLPNGQYGYMSGTSMAAPEVTGAMALVWGLHPTWNYTQVIDQVLNTTDKLPSLQGKVSSGGRLDVAAAVGWTLSTQTKLAVASVAPQGATPNSMNALLVTFNEAIDVSTFQSGDVTLTDPYGRAIPVTVNLVPNSGDRQVKLLFANQTTLGNYRLTINSYVHDLMGVPLTPYSSTVTLYPPQTFTNSTPLHFGSLGLAITPITVPTGITAGNVQVKLNVNYPVDKNLYVYLIAPTGKTIALDYNRGGTGANLTNTTFSQSASTSIASGSAPFSGTFTPEASLNQLAGINAAGTWRLAVRNYGYDSGTLLNWSLIITPSATNTANGGTASVVTSPPPPPPPPPPPVTASVTPRTFTNSTPLHFGSLGLAITPITVPTGLTVGNVQVKLNVNYPVDKNLYVYLIAPTGKTIALDYNRGGTGANLTNTTFSQSASTFIGSGSAPFSGTYRPEASLDQLAGINAAGTWRLAVRNYGYYAGTLLNWSLIITPAAAGSAHVSSVATPAPATGNSSPSSPTSPTTTTNANSPPPTLAGQPGTPMIPSALTRTNDAPPSRPTTSSGFLSSFRSLTSMLSNLLVGKRPGDNADGGN